jgi:uncharacterized protein (TIGR03382 family)
MELARVLSGRRAFAVGLLVFAARADATVTQVDGTIVPVTSRMQAALDTYELPAGTIDAVGDAAEVPQIFLPRLSSPVVFLDVREGAGFENSFGWYNVGDDVSTSAGRIANLHPVMGCGIPMVNGPGDDTHHSGNPAYYVQNAEEPNTISVDFAAERTAGRYKGGYIGFYLITPENNPSPVNCGDFKNDSNGMSLFGRIYFTQKDLNNDGDFVHHLVYRSPSTPDRFYFGFEDLFRGGDNDFEDMAMRIDGLTPPCVPQAEVCDGLDNDCDGLIDASDPDLTGTGGACTCDGVSMTCDNGPRFGVCQAGVVACSGGNLVCHGTGTQSSETCDGLDNNCNNQVDENIPQGAACDGPDADLCPEGFYVCTNGGTACSDNTGANIEACNGADDDCDGAIDEGNPGGGGSCGSSIGSCTPGTLTCQGGALVCVGGSGPFAEMCNGLDDNCNGVVDDMPVDVGQSCGATDVGECSYGQTICVGGSLQCAGEVGPVPETCNLRDDNCNGTIDDSPVDAGQPCGSSIGICTPGTYVCTNGALVCTGGMGPTNETCNGLDDDCDGTVDEMVPGEGQPCGGMGMCQAGQTKCIAGSLQCVGGATSGTEVCNGMDDDCDNLIDEGPLCNGGVCDNGQCALPCVMSEFPCPPGKKCDANNYCVDDPCYGVTCPVDVMGNVQSCVDGVCVPTCQTTTCPAGLVCRGSDAACVPDRCEYLPKCAANEVCIDGACQPNPCSGVTCPADEFCREGTCVKSCEGVKCPVEQACRDGACVPTGCDRLCDPQVCNPTTGACQDSKCGAVQCPNTEVCDPLTGDCIPDPCQGVTCPEGQQCRMGQCGTPARQGLHVTVGGGGCSTTGGDGSALLALVVLAVAVRRRRLRRGALACVVACAIAGGGCRVNDYCIACETDGDAGTGSGDGAGSGSDGGMTCDPMQVHSETCNHADDDCDGLIDEGFDLQTNHDHCGACGNACNKAGAQTACVAGGCTITGCFPGFFDINGDITGPYAQSDGCEYQCFQSNGGVEACDGIDNDCDGTADEGFNVTNDVNNCGACNRVCQFFQATPHCSLMTCQFDPLTDCNAGYHDIDGQQANGCEYACTPSNGGVEACDLVDNDCNGAVDETFMLMSDVNHCGRCGLVCQFPHATPSCMLGMCGFNPATDCAPGYVDVNGKQLDGCEYACSPTNGGVEICDGVDNDCDGVADDNPTDAGGPCAATSPPQGACVPDGMLTCSNGSLVCNGATQPTTEVCNNADDDCDSSVDDAVTQSCYTGPGNTNGVGACHGGTATCTAGVFGTCAGEVTPTSEQCNNIDDDCNGTVDDGPNNGPITATCYSGVPASTAGVGTCRTGIATCAFGAFGPCVGEVDPRADICGDGLDTDCDALDDAQEGCLAVETELRLDAPGGALGETTPGAQHSYDVMLARGGSPLGTNVYAVWSQLVGSTTEVYFRKSTNGGATWGTIQNLTSNVAASAVKPQIAVEPGATDKLVVAYQTVTGGVRSIQVQTSADAGATFSAASGALNGSGDSFHHVVAIRGSTCVVAWEQLDTATLNRDVMSRTSTTSCTSFNAETKINVGSPSTRFAGRPQVGITGSGGIVWAWREQRAGATRDIFAASAPNAATAPTADIRLDSDAMDKRDSDFPLMIVAGSSAYLVWQDVSTQQNGGADVMFVRSANGGATWSAERVIDDPVTKVSSSFTPTIAIDARGAGSADDVIAIAWEDRRQGTQIYASISSDGGATFATPIRASSDAGQPISGATSVPVIAAAGNGVLVVAYQNQLTNQRPHVYTASSIDGGATWTYTHTRLDQGAGAAISPQVVASVVSSQPAAVSAWTDFRAGGTYGDLYTAVSD